MEDLPKEIQRLITNLLELKSQRMLRSTNTKWFAFIRVDSFTLYFARLSTLPDMVDALLKYPYGITLRLEKIFEPRKYREMLPELCRLTNLQDLFIDSEESYGLAEYTSELRKMAQLNALRITSEENILENFSNLTHLDLYVERGSDAAFEIIRQNAQLRSIVLHKQSCDVASALPDPKQLTHLELLNQQEPFQFDLSKLYNLKWVSISNSHDDENHPIRLRGLTALEHLYIADEAFDSFESNTRLTYLKISNYYTSQNQILNSWHVLQNLRVLKMQHFYVDQMAPMEFFTALTALEKLTIRPWNIDGLDYVNRSSLTRLVVNFKGFQNCKNLLPFKNLQNLTIQEESMAEKPNYGPLLASSKLTRLSLSVYHNSKQKLGFVTNLTTLKCLKITGSFMLNNKVEFPPNFNLKSLTRLESLQLSLYNATMATLTNLTRLTLDGTSHYTEREDYDLLVLKGMSKLKILRIEYDVPDVAFKTIGTFTRLEELSLWCINDAKIKLITNLMNLKSLSVKNEVSIHDDDLTKFTNLQDVSFNMPGNAYPLVKLELQNKLPYLYKLFINDAFLIKEE